MKLVTIDLDKLHFTNMTGTKLGWVNEVDISNAIVKHRESSETKSLDQTRWIPVSEGLPKVAGCYNVTRQIGSDLIVDACYFDGTNTWHNDNRINHERNYLTNITAWWPLPEEPYKVESEERKERWAHFVLVEEVKPNGDIVVSESKWKARKRKER